MNITGLELEAKCRLGTVKAFNSEVIFTVKTVERAFELCTA